MNPPRTSRKPWNVESHVGVDLSILLELRVLRLEERKLNIMKIISCIISVETLILSVVVINLEAFPSTEAPKNYADEREDLGLSTVDEDTTQKILPPEPEIIDEFYNCEYQIARIETFCYTE